MLLFYSSADEKNATHVAFFPKKHRGQPEIVKFDKSADPPVATYQQKKRQFIDGVFHSLQYPVNLQIEKYLEAKGLTSDEVAKLSQHYGKNNYDIPIPSFLEILKEHMTAPFFIFQLFSIACWLFDEYITYPLMSLGSLILMEANTARTRQSNMLELRGVESEISTVYNLRDDKWEPIKSEKLLPGDIILLNQEIVAPADLLLLSGRVIVNEAMLTGESTPQIKESIADLDPQTILDTQRDRRHIVFGGTKIEQTIPGESSKTYVPTPGCVAYVLSTGLGSSQGKLIRTILFASQRVAAESKDAIQLLLFLTIFAVISAGYVIYYGAKTGALSSFRLIVEALLILTQTIPPDLPMELTFAVNSSLLALSKLQVFCTEPFRIPLAGSVSVCCFDKTGTITAEDYQLLGVDEMKNEVTHVDELIDALTTDGLSTESLLVLGGCHSLVLGSSGKLVGDSLESAAFTKAGFIINPMGKPKHQKFIINTIKHFHFSAELRRMSTISQIHGSNKNFVLTKGAPEAIADHLSSIPDGYFERYRNYTRQGCRVLALATKTLTSTTPANLVERTEAESNLTFCGFAIFQSPFKRGSQDTIAELLRSTHRVVIITGDDPLTACHVAKKLNMMVKPAAIVDLETTDVKGEKVTDVSKYSLCYTGRALDKLTPEEFDQVILHVNLFARMPPQSKAQVLTRLKEMGIKTMMCGDGTNDVGALKQADVGVGLLERSIETTIEEDEYKPKLGAASIAAPFVSKRATVSACIDLIRFGRATLSSTIDIFKQLSVMSFTTAFTSSVLFLQNVKFGDQQMTVFSLATTISFLSLSFSKPLRRLSTERPFENQFNVYLVISVIFQSCFHYFLFTHVQKMVFATGYEQPPFDRKVKFAPSLMNTAMFIAQAATQVATSLSNYRGRPFTQGFLENKIILFSFVVMILMLFGLIFAEHPLLRQTLFQLVDYPSESFKTELAIVCALDIVLSFVAEKITLFVMTYFNKKSADCLVEPEVLELAKKYKRKNDDVQDEEKHHFGIKDMFKQNYEIQKKMMIRNMEAKREEKLKQMTPLQRKKALEMQKRREQMRKRQQQQQASNKK